MPFIFVIRDEKKSKKKKNSKGEEKPVGNSKAEAGNNRLPFLIIIPLSSQNRKKKVKNLDSLQTH